MQLTKKLRLAGGGLAAATLLALPVSGVVSADPILPAPNPGTSASNSTVDVQTSYDCNTHTFQAAVTNKTDSDITPKVTFNSDEPNQPTDPTIAAGATTTYYYDYSGNNLPMATEVDTDGQQPLKLNPLIDCSEPVSFAVNGASTSAITGILTNNSTMVAQVALTQVGDGDVHVESLAPGESRLVAMSFNAVAGQNMALVNVGTSTGFESSYEVSLTQPPTIPILPMNIKK